MKAFELTEEQRNDLYFKNFDGTIKIDGLKCYNKVVTEVANKI